MSLALTKLSETATTITLGWSPVAGCIGYRFTREKAPFVNVPSGGQRRTYSLTYDPLRASAEFSKDSAWYRVEALAPSEGGDYPLVVSPPVPPQGAHWIGDFAAGGQDFRAFDMHDAQFVTFNDWAVGSTKDVTIVPKPPGSKYPFSNYMARVIVNNDIPGGGSESGKTINCWEPGAYSRPWRQRGAEVWDRLIHVIPDGTDPRYPGKLTPVPGDGVDNEFHVLAEWHKNDTAGAPGPTSTKLELAIVGGKPCFLFHVFGSSGSSTWLIETDQVQSERNGLGAGSGSTALPLAGNVQPLKFNHEYEHLFRWKLDPDPAVGEVDWYVDGQLRAKCKRSTMYAKSDGTVPGVSFQAGMYRSFPFYGGRPTNTTDQNEHVYIQAMLSGPTRASVGA